MKIIRIEYCKQCKDLNIHFMVAKAGCRKATGICERKKLREIGDWDKLMKLEIPIPEWCPLEEEEKK